ncbi:MAG TPA: tRNA preQ1(34) S-adenosylmethionine ribosyltransferase-isomerase QueA [Thermodesulfobacteriota bacterium]|nr:tRNA preQ1(34) S-adenosylmethionine ribosyltransferase-isomerase QueA [Thermodesulfobacteriota bacterium]
MLVKEFDYQLPPELVAQFPAPERDVSRLMVAFRKEKKIEHTIFAEIDNYLSSGDIIVVNDTKVRPAKIFGRKETGGRVEVLLLQPLNSLEYPKEKNIWEALIDCSKNPQIGSILSFGTELNAQVVKQKKGGLWDIELIYAGDLEEILERIGKTPLPPYIKREDFGQEVFDRRCYQTIFAQNIGSAAAPTAGLHFTERVLNRIKKRGVEVISITLHVGVGTFQPVRVDKVEAHRMHSEYYEIPPESAKKITQAIEHGQRIIACGTTSVRVLETWISKKNTLSGFTDLFIYPGYKFQVVKGMITNFHLPRSTLLMLVSAFAGKEMILRAYQKAIAEKYRFYSYGDAMLIL